VRTAGENGEGAVELFDEHDAREFVRISHRAERYFLRHAFAERGGKTVRVAANEDDFTRTAVALVAKPFRERIGVVLFSTGVEKKRCGSAVRVQALDGSFGVPHFVYFDQTRM